MKDYQISLNTSTILNSYYEELLNNYYKLESSYISLQEFYNESIFQSDIELTKLYEEQINLQNRYMNLEKEIQIEKESLQSEIDRLEKELDDIKYLKKSVILENRSIEIDPKENTTLLYDTKYAGYLEINFSSSSDIIIWIGSSELNETYYSRYPSRFPETAKEGSFKVPICMNTYIYVKNPNEVEIAIVDIHIEYNY